jgi:hypothetical protein
MRINLDITKESRFRMEGSWGATQWETGTLRITAWVNREKMRGGFEIYDVETRGNRAYAEGGLWFAGHSNDPAGGDGCLCDYDGVGSLDLRILDWLDDEGLIDRSPSDYFRKRIIKAAEKRGDSQ